VLAVFQGHDHKGAYSLINGIHYYTLKAIIEDSGPENNAYAVVDVRPDLNLTVTGFRKAVSMELVHSAASSAGM
jgi:alkaline phosphatase